VILFSKKVMESFVISNCLVTAKRLSTEWKGAAASTEGYISLMGPPLIKR